MATKAETKKLKTQSADLMQQMLAVLQASELGKSYDFSDFGGEIGSTSTIFKIKVASVEQKKNLVEIAAIDGIDLKELLYVNENQTLKIVDAKADGRYSVQDTKTGKKYALTPKDVKAYQMRYKIFVVRRTA